MAAPDIANGNVGGLLAFMDFMIEKGYGSAGAITPWKSAAKQIFSTVEGEGFDSLDVREFDIDDYADRFENRSIGKYSTESLRAYRQRFRKAVEAYRSYLGDPNWRPSLKRAPRPKKTEPAKGRMATKSSNPSTDEPEQAPLPRTPSLIAYPFPLKDSQMAQLHLPATGLDADDADRLTAFLRSLVFEQPPRLNRGPAEEE
jgi:hypothetical protein